MRIALAIALPLLAALLQAAIVPFIAAGDVRPNLPLLVAASWAVAAGAAEACWWAFIGGIAADLVSGGPLGAFAVASLPAVTGVGLGERPLARPVPVLAGVFFITLAALIAGLLYVAVLAVVGHPLPEPPALVLATFGGALYTGLLAIAVYPLARWLRRVTEQDSPF
ncbi:MAG TPA: rod shape-determining protein MreD [Candidatus Limnocylindria bacterium]|nr:rod shape-determining protein MreD [Candidatus Limnocylindria bacterium]